MKAIIYEGPKQVAVKNVPEPEVGPGEVLVRIVYAGICGTDLNIYAGTHPRAKAPLIPGHEFSGITMTDGRRFPKGTRVAGYPLLSCGHCEPCRTGNEHVCDTLGLLGIDCDGAMTEYIPVAEEKLVKLPDAMSDKAGAFVEPVAVTVHALRENHFEPGSKTAVFGCGTIGLATALTLRIFGAQAVTMFETDESRAAFARNMGFEVFSPIGLDMESFAREKTDGVGFDWVFDCAGVQPVANVLLDVVKVKGHIVIIAGYKKPAALPLLKGMFKEVSLGFTRVYRYRDFDIAANIMQREPDYEKIITHLLPLDEAEKGFKLLTTPGTGAIKVMFKI